MGRIRDLWNGLDTHGSRISVVISFFVAVAVIAGSILGGWWAIAKDKKDENREIARDRKDEARATAQDKKADARAIALEEQINRHINRLVSEQDQDILQLEQSHTANTEELTEKYRGEISDLNEEMKRFVERNEGMVLDETVRRIVASHGNIERAFEDAYEKALDEGSEGGYIFEINQVPGGAGSGVFVTEFDWRPGEGDVRGSSDLLTIEEKKNIELCFKPHFEKVKREKRKYEFVNKSTQEEMFWFLLRESESDIGCITEPLKRQIPRWTSYPYREKRIEVLTPSAKLGAIIGHIGDTITQYERGF